MREGKTQVTDTGNVLKKDTFKSQKYKLRNFLDEESELSFELLLKKSMRHKKLVLVSAALTFATFFIFRPEQTKQTFQQRSSAVFSSADNNTLFRSLDSLVPSGDDGRVSDDLNAYSEKAVTFLKSSDFVEFCYSLAKSDEIFRSVFNIENFTSLSESESKLKIIEYLKKNVDVTSSLDKKSPLVSYKNTKGGFIVKFNSQNEDGLKKSVPLITKAMGDFLAKKDIEDIQAARALIQDKLKAAQKDYEENTQRKRQLASEIPVVDTYGFAVKDLINQQSATKLALGGNKAMEVYFTEKINKLKNELVEKKLKKNNERLLNDELASLFYMISLNKQFGIDEQSFQMRRLVADLDKIKRELETKYNSSGLKNPDLSENQIEDVSVANKITSIQAENAFYENKIKLTDSMLERLSEDYNLKVTKEAEIKSLDTMLVVVQKNVDLLKNGLARLDVSDFKALRRVNFIFSPIEAVPGTSLAIFFIASLVGSLLIGMALSLGRELRNPSLTSIGSFEEIGLKVLGGLPSYKNPLFNDLDEKLHFNFAKCAINLENYLSYVKSKIVLFTPVEESMQSATVALNLGYYFSNTGSRVLIIETDLLHNCLVQLTGAPLEGGISELAFHKGDVSISPHQIQKGLDILTGNPSNMPKDYRLSSQDFFNLLSELKGQYDFIFIHAKSCLDGSDAADLSRYAGVSLVTCDSKTITIDLLEKYLNEMKNFLSKEALFVLEDPEDLLIFNNKNNQSSKVMQRNLRKSNGEDNSKEAA